MPRLVDLVLHRGNALQEARDRLEIRLRHVLVAGRRPLDHLAHETARDVAVRSIARLQIRHDLLLAPVQTRPLVRREIGSGLALGSRLLGIAGEKAGGVQSHGQGGAGAGGVSLEAKVMSQAGRNTLSNMGMVILFGGVGLFTGDTLRRNFTSAVRSSSAIPLNDVNGCTGRMRSPLGRRPKRTAVMICSSVQLPIPVFGSGVMLLEYTVPNGPSYLRPPALTAPFGSVWQPQPPVAPKTYLPRAS